MTRVKYQAAVSERREVILGVKVTPNFPFLSSLKLDVTNSLSELKKMSRFSFDKSQNSV